jgi:EAL domain-containing protein (putative c-di-GMP-specific phosphodiesterase class I)
MTVESRRRPAWPVAGPDPETPASRGEAGLFRHILASRAVAAHYQPLVSPRAHRVVGVEALCRGVRPGGGEPVAPAWLFARAREQGRLVELDRLCRRRALEGFARLAAGHPDLVLFLNFEAALVDTEVAGSGHLARTVRELGLDPRQVVIEIVESRVQDLAALERFEDTHRGQGFLLALDDMGAGHSNLDRIAVIKPDVIKLDRSLITGLDRQWYKQEIARALRNLAHKIGALVVAEGVERRAEGLAALELGVEILQGFYFAPPRPRRQCLRLCRGKLRRLAEAFRERTIERVAAREARHGRFEVVVAELRSRLGGAEPAELDARLEELLGLHPALECLYVLDAEGRQVSGTLCDLRPVSPGRPAMFRPAAKGADQSLKDYYLLLMAGLERYVSEPYISQASGNPCVTISTWFRAAGGRGLILCADFAGRPDGPGAPPAAP